MHILEPWNVSASLGHTFVSRNGSICLKHVVEIMTNSHVAQDGAGEVVSRAAIYD